MRKRSALSIMSPKKGQQSPSSGENRSSCDSFSLFLGTQLFIICMIVLAAYEGLLGTGMRFGSVLIYEPLQPNLRQINNSAKKADDAELQINFVRRADSWLVQVYHDEPSPALNGITQKLKAVPLSRFCKGSLAKSGPKYAIFKDVVLAERKLYLPSMINCSQLTTKPLTTRFNRGQGSSPELEVMVVPSADTFEDFEPHISCHERVYEPSVLFSFINWPQYGHAMFNGISLLWEIVTGPLSKAGKNVRLYAYGDSIVSHQRQEAQEFLPFFDIQTLEPLMGMFSHQPVRALASLLMQSDRHPVCFSYLLVGLSGELDHYNFGAPLKKWLDFSKAVKTHFGVMDPPRIPASILQRIAPEEALRGSNPELELEPINQIQWDNLPGLRPRLTILDRRSNRVIINVKELQKIAVEIGHFKQVEVVYLEEMNMEQQVQLMGITDVLFGIDGTGLMNGMFLPEGGVVVHVRPYGCAEFLSGKGVNFNRLWAANPGRVIRHESGDRNTTRFPKNIHEVPELVFSHNSSHSYRFPFILRQDTVVDPVAFRCILDSSHRLLHGVPVDWDSHRACTRTVFF
eukprot:Gb_24589 [translate_table: standard]